MSHSFDAFRLNSFTPDTLCPRAGIGQVNGSPLEIPIVQSTTFCKGSLASMADHAYSRVSNPTNSALEEALGQLEDAPAAVSFSMASNLLPPVVARSSMTTTRSPAR